MNTDRDKDDDAWVQLAMFYVRLPRLDGDPPNSERFIADGRVNVGEPATS
jgi:hypothetical protein